MVPTAVLAAYGWKNAHTEPATSGLINDTYFVRLKGERVAVLQKLHPVFGPSVNLDLEAVTKHLASHGMATPSLVRTTEDEPWVEHEDEYWRAITYLSGRTFEQVPSVDAARSAGELVGRFHRAMDDFEHEFVHVRTGVHDTAAHIAKLRRLRTEQPRPDVDPLADEILAQVRELDDLEGLPLRPCHGDLKISNVLFAEDSDDALCLIDLDTNAMQLIAYELGDALRSWCNPHAEDVEEPEVDLGVLAAAMEGYARGSDGLLSANEQVSITVGFITIPLELAARFCADAYEDSYFGWDASRYPSRRAHNLARARSQLRLGLAVRAAREAIDGAISTAFASVT